MDKIAMNKHLIALLALVSCAYGQTYKTVTADTNNVIRTNFTLGRAQVSDLSQAIFAISNITALQSVLDSKLAFDGTASNVSGVVAIANGGTGATNAANALVNLLPSYTGNSNAVLALNSNATTVVWSTNTGGSGGVTLNALGGLNLASDSYGSSTISTNEVEAGFAVGAGSIATNGGGAVGQYARTGNGFAGGKNSHAPGSGGAVGNGAYATNNGGAVGYIAESIGGGFSGGSNSYSTKGGAAIGKAAEDYAGGGAVGWAAVVSPSTSSATNGGGAVGAGAYAESGFAGGSRAYSDASGAAVGENSESINGFAGGKNAKSYGTANIQLGEGDNYDENTVQIFSAGTVDTNEWAAIAAISTYPTTNIQVTVVGGATNTLVFTNGILMNVTTP